MTEHKHTPGPWRWEFNAKHRSVQLVGGKPQFDLTIMDFVRWGMGGAAPRFIEPCEALNGLQLMHRVCDRDDWIAPFEGRKHHAHWCAGVTHPDALLMAAAPELLDLLIKARRYVGLVQCDAVPSDDPIYGVMDDIDAAIAKATGEPQ